MAQVRGSARNAAAATALVMMVTMTMLFHYCEAAGKAPASLPYVDWGFGAKAPQGPFKTGQSISFKFAAGVAHNLIQVKTLEEYNNCNGKAGHNFGTTTITVKLVKGPNYFICTVGTPKTHCESGMKLTIQAN